jgi:hypothetical protein
MEALFRNLLLSPPDFTHSSRNTVIFDCHKAGHFAKAEPTCSAHIEKSTASNLDTPVWEHKSSAAHRCAGRMFPLAIDRVNAEYTSFQLYPQRVFFPDSLELIERFLCINKHRRIQGDTRRHGGFLAVYSNRYAYHDVFELLIVKVLYEELHAF